MASPLSILSFQLTTSLILRASAGPDYVDLIEFVETTIILNVSFPFHMDYTRSLGHFLLQKSLSASLKCFPSILLVDNGFRLTFIEEKEVHFIASSG